MLQALKNRYGGVFVPGKELPAGRDEFRDAMAAALAAWSREGLKLAWLEIPARRGELLPDALDLGFKLHHGRDETLMLVRRLVDGAYIPDACTHSIGAGGLVLSEDRQILVVLEKRDRIDRPEHLKLPGGMLERGEHLADGAIREVFEETGIRTEFRGLVGMRHHHRGQFGASNIYAVCRLSPLNFDIHLDGDELEKALWMPVDEYLAREATSPFNRRVVQAALATAPLPDETLEAYMDAPDSYEVFMADATAGMSTHEQER
ncbi:NUDIX hydrolase [Wenzhouxiangella sediminis]|uniref:NUDIX domain-containing protein n=1 Tax=Wenzhouxiangella sediminis TaxID=1792836 RepID=A0A3E1K7E0_9GAMM|nr:NUDIX domain-containing protein [Wenzhouxiangella sediminis]RFF29955.1 NUDIX domain-containing protein [Wenzhouxiangella sediminis]